jgi:hypothetical protein
MRGRDYLKPDWFKNIERKKYVGLHSDNSAVNDLVRTSKL